MAEVFVSPDVIHALSANGDDDAAETVQAAQDLYLSHDII